MRNRIPWIVAFAASSAGALFAQSTSPPIPAMAPGANPVFAVATIKPGGPDERSKRLDLQGHRFITINSTLNDLIVFAYGIHPRQLVGGPAWVETGNYDLVAEPEATGRPSVGQLKLMVQKLLADRFKLTLHRDKKELSAYVIEIGQKGPKLTNSQDDPNGLPVFSMGRGMLRVRNTSIADLAGLMLVVVLDRPALDRTGLTGRYDFTLRWTPDEFQFGGAKGEVRAPTADAPHLVTAMQKQLGLKLESTKTQADVLVVEHVEKPSEN